MISNDLNLCRFNLLMSYTRTHTRTGTHTRTRTHTYIYT